MKSIGQLMTILSLLTVMAALTYAQEPVRLNGSEGMALLMSITKSPLNLTNSSQNLTNSSQNMAMASNASSDLWSWGGKPKDPPGSRHEDDYLNDSDLWAL